MTWAVMRFENEHLVRVRLTDRSKPSEGTELSAFAGARVLAIQKQVFVELTSGFGLEEEVQAY